MIVPEELHEYAPSVVDLLRKRFILKGITLNKRKFYDQPYKHGLEFLGSHIRPNRIHLNNKTFERGVEKAFELNKIKDKERYVDSFICSINSYTGMLKNRTDYKRMMFFIQHISNDWWKYTFWNSSKQCVAVYPKYSERERLNRKYRLHLKFNFKKKVYEKDS